MFLLGSLFVSAYTLQPMPGVEPFYPWDGDDGDGVTTTTTTTTTTTSSVNASDGADGSGDEPPSKVDLSMVPLVGWLVSSGSVRQLSNETLTDLANNTASIDLAYAVLYLYYPVFSESCSVEFSSAASSEKQGGDVRVEYYDQSILDYRRWGGLNETLTLNLTRGIIGREHLFIVRIVVDAPYTVRLHKALATFHYDFASTNQGYTILPLNRLSPSLSPVWVSDSWLLALAVSSAVFTASVIASPSSRKPRRGAEQFFYW